MDDEFHAGRLYTGYPLRLKQRAKYALGLGLLVVIFATDQSLEDEALLSAAMRNFINTALWSYPVFLLWPTWPFGKRIRLNDRFFSVGMRRFDIREMSNLRTTRADFRPGKFAEILRFQYGRKDIQIKVRNSPSHAIDIAGFLNAVRERLLTQGAVIEPDAPVEIAETRAAAF